jgi:hypothetical protein
MLEPTSSVAGGARSCGSGATGFIGSAIVRQLAELDCARNSLFEPRDSRREYE